MSSILCKIGIHKWDGCRCTSPGCWKRRANLHVWNACKCEVCGSRRPEDDPSHSYAPSTGFCEHCGCASPPAAIQAGWYFWSIPHGASPVLVGECLERIDDWTIRARVWSTSAPHGERGKFAVSKIAQIISQDTFFEMRRDET